MDTRRDPDVGTPQALTLARAALPEVLFPDDLAVVLRLASAESEEQVRKGMFGPWFTVAGVPAVLRDHFLETLSLRAGCKAPAAKEVVDPTESRLSDQAARPGAAP